MSHSLEKAEQKLNSGNQSKDDIVLKVAPHANMIQKITPAPLTVAVLAELALLSTSHADFKLEQPQGGFKKLKWTQFKPSLMQVSHEGWEAFNRAHSGMNEIRQLTDRIPGDMKQVLNILLNMPDDQVAALLPISLESLEEVADSCLARSKEVEGKFNSVRELTDELLQSSLSTESTNKNRKETLAFEKQQKEKEEAFFEIQKQEMKKNCEKAEKEVEKRSKEYENSLDSMPSGWSLLGMKVVEGLSNAASEMASLVATRGMSAVGKAAGLTSHLMGKSNGGAQPTKEEYPGGDREISAGEPLSFEDTIVYNNMKQHCQQIQHAINMLFTEDGFNRDAKEICAALVMFKKAEKDLNSAGVSPDLTMKRSFYEELIGVCRGIEKECHKGDPVKADDFRGKLVNLLDNAIELESMANAATGTLGLNKKTPFMSKSDSGNGASNDDSAATLAVKMAQSKMEMTAAQLQNSQEQYNKASEDLAKVNMKLADTLREISQLDLETATIHEILEMLRKGLLLLSKLREQWGQLTMFFEEMAILIKANLHSRTNKFIKQSDQLGKLKMETGMSPSKFSKDLIYSSARDVVGVGYVVNRLATQYFQVSEQYLMPPMGRLSQLMVLDKDMDKVKIMRLKEEIMAECEEAQSAITDLVSDEKKKFNASIQQRMKNIESELMVIVNNPSVSQEERMEITMEAKKAVKKGRSKVPNSKPAPLFDDKELEEW